MSTEYITVGKLGRTRGLSGEIYITPSTDFPERFLGLKEIFVRSGNQWEKQKIVSTRLIAGRPVIKFKNINNPEEAARMTNRSLAVLKEEVVDLPKGSFYIFDLVGSEVFDHKSNQKIGKIVEVKQYPANDVYEILTPDDKKIYCPAVKQFVTEIDVEKKKVVIDQAGTYSD